MTEFSYLFHSYISILLSGFWNCFKKPWDKMTLSPLLCFVLVQGCVIVSKKKHLTSRGSCTLYLSDSYATKVSVNVSNNCISTLILDEIIAEWQNNNNIVLVLVLYWASSPHVQLKNIKWAWYIATHFKQQSMRS